ncbi:efflux RND transporter periplasmic adaptor subunit [Stieleria sp. ICT_E10.1]|uniref:efflux RND transporter periplasmic adaptor subunit n=1 Tax=Stieleria sedimenti TaxID=2976331 RepID=UPI00217F817F|nr:efflux RND transporter periplasmic adaptor subunit [Stieleria sedimenti]MCS7467586.1 efflux RND transporter periplasmic adaptor subunit [Stieleria sedimenti]
MNITAPHLFSGLLVVCCCACHFLGADHCHATPPRHTQIDAPKQIDTPAEHLDSFSGFTEPFREIKLCVAESGSVDTVLIHRGMTVDARQLLMTLDCDVLQANRNVAAAKAESTSRIDALTIESDLKQQRYEKLQQLLDDGAGSVEEVRRAKADASVAMLEVEAARQEMRLRKLELREIEARIEQRRVYSPISGVITDVTKQPGEYVSQQEPHVATVVQLDRLRVTLFVPTSVAGWLDSMTEVDLWLTESDQRCVGRIDYVGVVTEADSGRVRVDLLIDNPNRHYRSGVRCQLRTTRERIRPATLTPTPRD